MGDKDKPKKDMPVSNSPYPFRDRRVLNPPPPEEPEDGARGGRRNPREPPRNPELPRASPHPNRERRIDHQLEEDEGFLPARDRPPSPHPNAVFRVEQSEPPNPVGQQHSVAEGIIAAGTVGTVCVPQHGEQMKKSRSLFDFRKPPKSGGVRTRTASESEAVDESKQKKSMHRTFSDTLSIVGVFFKRGKPDPPPEMPSIVSEDSSSASHPSLASGPLDLDLESSSTSSGTDASSAMYRPVAPVLPDTPDSRIDVDVSQDDINRPGPSRQPPGVVRPSAARPSRSRQPSGTVLRDRVRTRPTSLPIRPKPTHQVDSPEQSDASGGEEDDRSPQVYRGRYFRSGRFGGSSGPQAVYDDVDPEAEDLFHISTTAPVDISMGYEGTGHVTTCIRYESAHRSFNESYDSASDAEN